jgi:hypothetical protein
MGRQTHHNLNFLHPVVYHVSQVYLGAVDTTINYKPILKYLVFDLRYLFQFTKFIVRWVLWIKTAKFSGTNVWLSIGEGWSRSRCD